LKKMSIAVEGELRSLLIYYGEQPDSPDAPKPEDLFGLISSFASSLQVRDVSPQVELCLKVYYKCQKCALEVHDTAARTPETIPKAPTTPSEETISELVCVLFLAF
jgi:diaphanous 1